MFFTLLIIFVAVFVLSEILRAKPEFENARPSVIGDFQFPTTQQNRPVPIFWGTVRQKGPNVVWYGDLEQRAITEKVKTGLFSSERVVRGFQYFMGIQFVISRGVSEPVTLLKIFVAEDLVFTGSIAGEGTANINLPELFGGQELGSGGIVGDVSWRPGTLTQTVNSYLSGTGELAISGVTPRWIGTAYATAEHIYIGNTTSIKAWSFEVRRIPNPLGLPAPDISVNSGNDCNPISVIYEAMTDTEWGLGYPAADIDSTDFSTSATTCRTEGNGFSMMMDRSMSAQQLIDEVARQIDGVVFLDHRTGRWKIKLARAEIASVPLLTSPVKVPNYTSGTWEDTTNSVTVMFSDRAQDYAAQPSVAQDMANAMIQGGGTVTTGTPVAMQSNYPGIKDATLANQIAWRDLRVVSTPLIQASVTVTREFWDVTPGGVIDWTDAVRGLVARRFRIKRIDYGNLEKEEIGLELVEDIFQFLVGSYGAPASTMWVPPSQTAVAFPAAEQLAFEAPRGLVFRGVGFVQSLMWASGRRTSGAASFKVTERNDVTDPAAGSISEIAEGFQFILIGELVSSLDASQGNAIPLTPLLVDATPDNQTDLEAAFTDSNDPVDVGTNLVNLIKIDNEFMLCLSAQTSGGDVQLNSVYRGVLDGGTEDHAAGASVFVMHAGGVLGEAALPETNFVDIRLLTRTPAETLASGSANEIEFQMDRRVRRPYCPGSVDLEGVLLQSTASLEGNGSAAEDFGLDVDFTRRDYRTAEGGDEIQALETDAATLFGDFPTVNTTTTEIEVVDDPDGTPTSLFTDTAIAGTAHTPLRIEILRANAGVLPTQLRLLLRARHLDASTNLLSREALQHDFAVTSALTGQFEFGSLDTSVTSALYTVDAAGVHNFTLSSAFGSGNVEISENGGGFTTLIAAASTTGASSSLSVSDTIEIRHDSVEVGPKQIDMAAPGAGTDAFGIFFS